MSSLSTSVKRAIKQMPTTDLEILANGASPMTPMTDNSSLSTSVKRDIEMMPTTDLKVLAGLKKHKKPHTYSTSSLKKRSTTSLKRQVGLKTSSLKKHHMSSSLADSPGQCPRGQVFHIQDGCIPKHSHKSAHHHLVHKLHKANSKA